MKSNQINIVLYDPRFSEDFIKLNEAWINQYFRIEESDRKQLHQHQEYILDKGGYILFALSDDKVVGTCALIKIVDPIYDFELVKMAVSPEAQGLGIGYKIGKAIVDLAREKGAKKIYLESNRILKPAIHLYRKLGFEEIESRDTPYARCDIQMELVLP